MKIQTKPRTIQIPEWIDRAVCDLAEKNKRSVSRQIECLIEEALKETTSDPLYADRHSAPLGGLKEAVNA
jgi:hypothetical protein